MDNYLKETLEKINKWLSYAEIKNGLLLTTYVAFFPIILKKDINGITLMLYLLGITINLSSFFPDLNTEKKSKIKDIEVKNNILFYFGDIVKYKKQPELYLKHCAEKYDISLNKNSELLKDYSSQIIKKSIITKRKFTLFRFGLVLFLITFILTIISLIK